MCCTGSVATVKIPEIVCKLINLECNVKVVVTNVGEKFLNAAERYDGKHYALFKQLLRENAFQILRDEDEWHDIATTYKVGVDPVLHIELRRWANLILVAPISANSLAKISNGLCDNLLTSIIRACDSTKKILLAPAMNTMMWENPITQKQLRSLPLNFEIILPVSKTLACNDVGNGALAPVDDIIERVKFHFMERKEELGKL